MTNPEEIIDSWRKHIKHEKDEDMLRCILQDLKMELNDAEDWVFQYECLIEDIENKLEKTNGKSTK